MNFAFIKDNKIDIKILEKKWNDNFRILERISVTIDGFSNPQKVYYTLTVWRNNREYQFNLEINHAHYLIWKLNLVTIFNYRTYNYKSGFMRSYFNKTAYSKVAFGYKNKEMENVKWEDIYF